MRWVTCADGVERWGPHGAAGILFVHGSQDRPKRLAYYLTHRSPQVHHGGTWGLPGGAIDDGEDALQAALREAREEVGYTGPYGVLRQHVYQPCSDWSYTTVVASVPKRFIGVFEGDSAWETQDGGWFSVSRMMSLPLHPALRSSLPEILGGTHA